MDEPLAWFQSLPPITRAWFGFSLTVTGAVTLDFLSPSKLIFDFRRIQENLELWRLVTCFVYAEGHLRDFGTLVLLYLIVIFSNGYERNAYNCGGGGGSADYAFALLFCVVAILASYPLILLYGPLLPGLGSQVRPLLHPLFTRTLCYSVLYLWSRRYPDVPADVYFIPMTGKYVPLAHVGFSLCLGHRINDIIHGLLVGHLFYWLVDVLPALWGKSVLSTPRFLVLLLEDGQGFGHDHLEDQDVGLPPLPDEDEDVGLPPMPRRDL